MYRTFFIFTILLTSLVYSSEKTLPFLSPYNVECYQCLMCEKSFLKKSKGFIAYKNHLCIPTPSDYYNEDDTLHSLECPSCKWHFSDYKIYNEHHEKKQCKGSHLCESGWCQQCPLCLSLFSNKTSYDLHLGIQQNALLLKNSLLTVPESMKCSIYYVTIYKKKKEKRLRFKLEMPKFLVPHYDAYDNKIKQYLAYYCVNTQKSFLTKKSFNRHTKQLDARSKCHMCTSCNGSFKTPSALKQHTKDKHPSL